MAKKLSYKEKEAAELVKELAKKREELRTLRFSAAGARAKDSNAAGKARKEIARIMTELASRKKAA